MAHYAYKHACYDLDYEKFQQLVKQFEQEEGREHDGDSNYDGDNWYIMAMWINELRAKIAELESRASPASVPEGFTMSEPEILPDGSGFGTMTEREATLLGKVERQSAALKLAREALFDMQDSYAAVHGWKDSFVIAATTAIAAIDSLQKGE